MRFIGALLLIAVIIRHNASFLLAENSSISRAGWFYILGGIWEYILCLTLLCAFLGQPRNQWRALAIAAMIIGMLESFQMSACRLMIVDIKAVPAGINLCDFVTGLPIGATLTTLYLLIIGWAFYAKYRSG